MYFWHSTKHNGVYSQNSDKFELSAVLCNIWTGLNFSAILQAKTYLVLEELLGRKVIHKRRVGHEVVSAKKDDRQ